MRSFTQEHKNKLAKATKNTWQDPTYRAKMIERQKQLGYRTYDQ